MERYYHSAYAVIMHHKIVYADYSVIVHYSVFNFLHQFLFRLCAKQRSKAFLECAEACIEDKKRNNDTCVCIKFKAAEQLYEHTDDYYRCRNAVWKRICRCSLHCGAVYFPTELCVEQCHPQLHKKRCSKHRYGEYAELRLFGREDFFDRAFTKLKAHHHYDKRNYYARNILHSAVTVGVFAVCRHSCHFKADKGHYWWASVWKVIECVCDYGDTAW